VADVGVKPFPAAGLPDEIDLAPAYPNYVMVRRKYVRRVLAHPRDENREPFIVQYDIWRVLRGKNRRGRRFAKRPLLPCPAHNRRGRWQLEVVFKVGNKNRRTPYHRLVGLACCPCTSDHLGFEWASGCPFFVRPGELTNGLYEWFWEVHHGDGNLRNNTAGNLFTLWWEVHRGLPRLAE